MLRALFLGLSLAACTGGSSPDDTSDTSDTGEDTDAEVTRASDLGAFCPMGCNLETCVNEESEDCETSLCLYDGRFRVDSYCTQPCDAVCPEGYTCMTPADGTGDVCFADPAVCGDGVVQRGEACDDGNTADGDFCAGNCLEVTVPPSGGTMTFGQPDQTPVTFEGTEPTVFAYRSEREGKRYLQVGWSSGPDTFTVELADVDRVSVPGAAFANVSALFGVCNFAGAGQVATLDAYDTAAATAKGTYEVEMACFANCFDCGGNGARRTYLGTFDVRWRDVE